jgi:hypothetical protein
MWKTSASNPLAMLIAPFSFQVVRLPNTAPVQKYRPNSNCHILVVFFYWKNALLRPGQAESQTCVGMEE